MLRYIYISPEYHSSSGSASVVLWASLIVRPLLVHLCTNRYLAPLNIQLLWWRESWSYRACYCRVKLGSLHIFPLVWSILSNKHQRIEWFLVLDGLLCWISAGAAQSHVHWAWIWVFAGLFHHSITLAALSGTRPLGVMDIRTSFQSLLLGEKVGV